MRIMKNICETVEIGKFKQLFHEKLFCSYFNTMEDVLEDDIIRIFTFGKYSNQLHEFDARLYISFVDEKTYEKYL